MDRSEDRLALALGGLSVLQVILKTPTFQPRSPKMREQSRDVDSLILQATKQSRNKKSLQTTNPRLSLSS
jgi:hypothetical protein